MKYTTVETDLGTFALFARADYLSRLDLYKCDCDETRARIAADLPDATEIPRLFPDLAKSLCSYAQGTVVDFDTHVDLTALPPFTSLVLTEIRRIPYGRLMSYGTIARLLGCPHAARAVGQALKRNPIPVVIPCHRVVRDDGTLGGFDMGQDMKTKLLALEGIRAQRLRESMILS